MNCVKIKIIGEQMAANPAGKAGNDRSRGIADEVDIRR